MAILVRRGSQPPGIAPPWIEARTADGNGWSRRTRLTSPRPAGGCERRSSTSDSYGRAQTEWLGEPRWERQLAVAPARPRRSHSAQNSRSGRDDPRNGAAWAIRSSWPGSRRRLRGSHANGSKHGLSIKDRRARSCANEAAYAVPVRQRDADTRESFAGMTFHPHRWVKISPRWRLLKKSGQARVSPP